MSEIAKKAPPTMSEALKQWLQRQGVSTRVDTEDARKLLDQAETAGLAAIVVKGHALKCIREGSEEDFQAEIRKRDIAHSTAYLCIQIRDLFDELGDLTLVSRAAALGATRIRELKPLLDYAGVHQLIEQGRCGDLTYEDVLNMSKRQLVDWRKRRAQQMLAAERARGRREIKPPKAPAQEPPAATIFREEGLATTARMRAETALLSAAIAKLPGDTRGHKHESWLRAGAVATASELAELLHDLEAVRTALIERFGAGLEQDALEYAPDASEHPLRQGWIEEVHRAAEERTRERHQRNHWRGRPATKRGLAH